jgi:D-beta-D-heptose 7-phosphate kinase/D-beta-D-heptose 1-phosphate adenosyltransferase
MATIFANGCFDILHEGHRRFLNYARHLGNRADNRLIVAVNSDESARELKAAKWGAKYPIRNHAERMRSLQPYCDEVFGFDTEAQLHEMIEWLSPCIIVKGPDYAGRENLVTGSDIAPVLILDTPETAEIRAYKRQCYDKHD